MGTYGVFRFSVSLLVEDEEDDEGERWIPEGYSGLYDSLESAERVARAILPWLREQISN